VLAQALAQPRTDLPQPPADIITSSVEFKPATDTSVQTDSQQAFTAAARKLVEYDRPKALEKYPELAHLPGAPIDAPGK
jgi:phospholipase C